MRSLRSAHVAALLALAVIGWAGCSLAPPEAKIEASKAEGIGKAAFVDLLRTAVAQGVGQLQFNVVNAETLRAAQQEPERYRNLCVRVSGFSQQFGLLDPVMQEHVIARTKHTC